MPWRFAILAILLRGSCKAYAFRLVFGALANFRLRKPLKNRVISNAFDLFKGLTRVGPFSMFRPLQQAVDDLFMSGSLKTYSF